MRLLASVSRAFCVAASLAFLASCGIGGETAAFTGAPRDPAQPGAHRGKSWMIPKASGGPLLYISDSGAGVVDVYSYPGAALVGMLSGFSQPMGICSDTANGNIWITDETASRIVEYAHGGTTPIGTISESGERPYSCSVFQDYPDVANISSASGGPGSILHDGTVVHPHGFASVHYVWYARARTDALFLDGTNTAGGFKFAEFPPHRNHFYDFKLPVDITSPGVVSSDGSHVDVADQNGPNGTTVVYRFTMKKEKATLVGSVPLSTSVGQYTIYKGMLVGPYASGGTVGFWNFPAGGSPTKVLTGFVAPFGSAISTAPNT